jgi:uncharacterized damage-inducible protein DinB
MAFLHNCVESMWTERGALDRRILGKRRPVRPNPSYRISLPGEAVMRFITVLLVAVALFPGAVAGQTFKASTNPVTDTMRDMIARSSKNLVASAELLPAEKYTYHPTEPQMTFAQLVVHIVQTNVALCSGISQATPPWTPEELKKMGNTDPKDTLVGEIRRSFDYCTDALAKATDADLAGEATMFGRPTGMSRGAVMIVLATDWADHYSTAASYLRMNEILPPTAQPKK